jgi:hypothetical protein
MRVDDGSADRPSAAQPIPSVSCGTCGAARCTDEMVNIDDCWFCSADCYRESHVVCYECHVERNIDVTWFARECYAIREGASFDSSALLHFCTACAADREAWFRQNSVYQPLPVPVQGSPTSLRT